MIYDMILWLFIFLSCLALYRYCIRGIYWIVSMKLKYGNLINYWYFPVLGGLVKILIVANIKHRNAHRNLVLEKRLHPK